MLLTTLTQLPQVQSFIGSEVASVLSKKLGTEVRVGHVGIEFFNRIIIDDVLIYDQQQRKMLKASRLSIKVDLLPLTQGRISISTAQVFGAHIALYREHADAPHNFQFVLDSLASRDTTSQSSIDLRVNTFIMRHSSIRYDQLDAPPTERKFNPNHLNLTDISAHIILKAFREDSLNLHIKKLAFKEQSGLQIDRMSMHLEASQKQATIKNLVLLMPQSKFTLGPCSAHFALEDKRLVPHSLRFQGSIEPSKITLSDIECFLPGIRAIPNEMVVSSSFSGTDNGLDIHDIRVTSASSELEINAHGYLHQWDGTPVWNAHLDRLQLSANSVAVTLQQLQGKVNVPSFVERLGYISMTGDASGEGNAVNCHANLLTDIGQFRLNLSLDNQRRLNGHVESSGVMLNQLLANEQFGQASMNIDVNGHLPSGGSPQLTIKGNLPRFDYNDYLYQNIDVDASYSSQHIGGTISIDDPNIVLTAEGLVEKATGTDSKASGSMPYNVRLTADVHSCSPYALHFTDQWPDARFGADIEADFTASNINDAEGFIDIRQFTMQSPRTDYQLDYLHMETGYNEDDLHYVTLASDFANASLQGSFDYATLPRTVTNLIAAHLPTLPGLPEVEPTENNFSFDLHLKRTDFLTALFDVPVQLVSPLNMTGYVNDRQDGVQIQGACQNFIYSNGRYSDLHLLTSTRSDSLLCDVDLIKHMDNGTRMSLALNASAADNNLAASFRWDNHEPLRMSGILNTSGRFFLNEMGEQTGVINVLPSRITLHNADWQVKPSQLTYSKDHLFVHDFAITHDGQHVTINGHGSKSVNDTLTVDLSDVDVEYVLDLVNFHSVDFSGLASGRAQVAALFATPSAEADLTVRNFLFEGGRMGTLTANAAWNTEKNRIDIHGICNDGPDAVTHIDGFIDPSSPGEIDLTILALGTHIDFAHSFTSAFASRVEGQGNGNVRIFGPLNAINMQGSCVVSGEVDIKQLGTTYRLENDSVWFEPDLIAFDHAPMYDRDGNSASVNGRLYHHNLSHWTFDIDVSADNLLGYDFHDFGDMPFYGTIYGSGNVGIIGRPGSIVFDIDVNAQPNSILVYNASVPDAISRQEFITWREKHEADSLSTFNPSPSTFNPSPSTKSSDTDMTLNFLVHCTPSSTVRLLMDARTGDYITLNGDGSFRASYYNKGTFNMFGTYVVDRGTYNITIQELIKKDFTFQRGGTIAFSGNPFNAQLNLQAQHTVSGVSLSDLNVGRSFSSNTVRVNCLMNIGGTAGAPRVDFDLAMPTVSADEQQMVRSVINGQQEMNQQVIYLLGIGRFYPQTGNNASTDGQSQQSQTALAMQSLLSGTLSSQINSLLSRVVNSKQWNFGANISTGDEGWRNAEYEGILSGRLLNNRLLLNGQFGYRDNATTATTSFIGDFDVQYLLTPSGSIAVKMYNQTNDRYFTRSSLNTQGLGIILKKDFTTLGDLFGIRRKRLEVLENSEASVVPEASTVEEEKDSIR